MTINRNVFLTALFLLAFGGLQAASAALITDSLGNTASGFSDGDTPIVPIVGGAQGGQPAPFDTSYGSDIGVVPPGDPKDFTATWTHDFGAPIADPILGASLTIGIYDHDSAASGSQLLSFSIDGNDFTTPLDILFEAGGGAGDNVYKEYTLSLNGILGFLSDGMALITLALQGNGLVPTLFPLPGPNPPTETANNGANLLFSTLTIETQDMTIPAVPLPAAAPLFLSAIFVMGIYRRRVLRSQA